MKKGWPGTDFLAAPHAASPIASIIAVLALQTRAYGVRLPIVSPDCSTSVRKGGSKSARRPLVLWLRSEPQSEAFMVAIDVIIRIFKKY